MLRFAGTRGARRGRMRRIMWRKSAPERKAGFETELMQVTGPDDGSCVCGDWLGAVVSVSGHSEAFPSLDEALRDGVFHEGCRHKLVSYVPDSTDSEKNWHALFCTELAVSAMNARVAKLRQTLQKTFTRLYEEARQADGEKNYALAHAKCTETLELVRNKNVFGRRQERMERALKARIRSIENSLQLDHGDGPLCEDGV